MQEFSFDPSWLRIVWSGGHTSVYDAIWLRDNCPEDRDRQTGQRLVDIADLPEEPEIGAVGAGAADALLITWSGEPKSSWFNLEWLRNHCYCDQHRQSSAREPLLWSADRTGELPWMEWEEVLSCGRARAQWLRGLADYGLVFLRNVPCADRKVVEAARLIGYIRETNYGRVFDVRPVVNPNNLAYSGLGLGLHTDNPYRDPVPGIQILHCLQSSDEGGESLFVDGFAVAAKLKAEDPAAFETLTRVPAPFLFRDRSTELRAERCLLELDAAGRLEAVHYNSRSIAPQKISSQELPEFYRAYRLFARLLRTPEFEYRVKLGNGDLAAFNNRRVLHGRTAIVPGAAERRLQGCYVEWDGLLSNLAVLERGL